MQSTSTPSTSNLLVIGVEQPRGAPAGQHLVDRVDHEEPRRVAVVAFAQKLFVFGMRVADMGDRRPARRRSTAAASSDAAHRRRRGSFPRRCRAPAAAARSAPWRWRAGGWCRPSCLVGPPDGRLRNRIDRGEVGLHVDDRRAVERIDGFERQRAVCRRRCRDSLTTCRPIGFGRAGERKANTPLASLAWRGFWTIRLRSAWCNQVSTMTWLQRFKPRKAGPEGLVDVTVAGRPASRAAFMFFGQSSRVCPWRADAADEHDLAVAGEPAGSKASSCLALALFEHRLCSRHACGIFLSVRDICRCIDLQTHIKICLYLFGEWNAITTACDARRDG